MKKITFQSLNGFNLVAAIGLSFCLLTGCRENSETVPFGLAGLATLDNSETRSISAENMTGERGKGGMAIPDPKELKPAASARAADVLGQGWKVKPFLRVNAGETVTLMDVDEIGRAHV